MAHLILLEDEPVLREELTDFFQTCGHVVSSVASLAEFQATFNAAVHRLAIVDLGLGDGDGLDLIARLRDDGHRLGIIVLTARGALEDKVAGLMQGADHYLSKTVDLEELAAVVDALARRLALESTPRWTLQGAPRRLTPPGFAAIPLSEQDFIVLHTLAAGGRCVTREAIIQALGADFYTYDQRRLDSQMRRLRRKVEEACGLTLPVDTIRSVGFRFHAEVDILR